MCNAFPRSIWRSAFGLLVLVPVAVASPDPFDPGCQLPFEAIKVHDPMDESCPRRGDVPDPPTNESMSAHGHPLGRARSLKANRVPDDVTHGQNECEKENQ